MESRSCHCAPKDDGPLGPQPRRSVRALAELGLNDGEIARYFGVAPGLVRQLRAAGASGPIKAGARLIPRAPAFGSASEGMLI